MENQQLAPGRIQVAEYKQVVWFAEVEAGTSRERLLNPLFWAHVASKLRRNNKIEVACEDDSFYATYLVKAADRTWARVIELSYIELNKPATLPSEVFDDYEVKLRGPKRWSVLRKSDRSVLQENLHTKEDAEDWLKVHLAA